MSVDARRQRFVILQPVELARAGTRAPPSGARTTTSTMFGVRRITSCTTARSSSFSCRQQLGRRGLDGRAPREHARDHRIALLRAAHRLHHVAGERRMQVAEEADRAPVLAAATSARATCCGFAIRSGFTGLPVFVDGLEVPAVERTRCARPRAPAPCWAACRRPPGSICAGSVTRLARRQQLAVASSNDALQAQRRRRARTASTSTSSGARHSAKRTPSSSAFATSS